MHLMAAIKTLASQYNSSIPFVACALTAAEMTPQQRREMANAILNDNWTSPNPDFDPDGFLFGYVLVNNPELKRWAATKDKINLTDDILMNLFNGRHPEARKITAVA